MDLEKYKVQKLNNLEGSEIFRKVCLRCRKSLMTCYCHLIKAFRTDPLFVILIHPHETRNSVGTGRMAHLCLVNSYLVEGVDFRNNDFVNRLIQEDHNFPVMLYPGKNSIDLSKNTAESIGKFIPKDKKLIVFVVDGSWSQAKKMMKLGVNFHKLPRVSFTPLKKSNYAIRVQPNSICVSTIEAVYQVIEIFDSLDIYPVKPKGAHTNLLDVFSYMVNQQLSFANNSLSNSYRKKISKPDRSIGPSKKWKTRPLFFRG